MFYTEVVFKKEKHCTSFMKEVRYLQLEHFNLRTTMLKLLNTSVAKLVGATSAVVFQHICYWMQTQHRETVYRTNKQLSEDLDGIYSVQQIQRAKKKLIDEGLIVVTADKRDVWNRTSHYSLTQKGRALLLSINTTKDSNKNTHKTLTDDTQNVVDSTKEVKTSRKQSWNKQAKYERTTLPEQTTDCRNTQQVACKSNNALEHNKAMKESFKEGFSNVNAVPMPDNIKNLIKRKKPCLNETTTDNDIEKDWTHSDECLDEQYSDDEYNDSVIAMLTAIDKQNSRSENERNTEPMTFAELMKTAYNKATTEAQEQMYRMKQEMQQYKYCEDC